MLAKGTEVKWRVGGAAWAQGVIEADEDKDGNVLMKPRTDSTSYPGTVVQAASQDKRLTNPDEPEQSRRIWAPAVPLIVRCRANEVEPA